MRRSVTFAMIAVLILLMFIVFRDKIEIESVSTDEYVAPSEDVVNQFGQLSVLGYEWLSEAVHWIDEEHLEFEGRRFNTEKAVYGLNTKTLELSTLVDRDVNRNTPLYNGESIQLYKGHLDDGLYVCEGGQEKIIATSQTYDDKGFFRVSANEDKVALYNPSESLIQAYDVSSHKFTKLQYPCDDRIDLDAVFSDDGGFITFAQSMIRPSESIFQIVGADSGRFYGKNIKGISPIFSPNSKTLAFIYAGDMDEHYNGGKIGLFVLKHKKIVYLDTLMNYERIFPILSWSEDSNDIYGVTQISDDSYMFNAFDVTSGTRKSLVLQGKAHTEVSEILVRDNKAYIVFDKGVLCTLDIETGRYNFTEGVLRFDNGSHIMKIKSDNYLVFTDSELHLLTPKGYRLISSYDAAVKGIYLSPEESSVCLLLKDKANMFLKIAKIDEKS